MKVFIDRNKCEGTAFCVAISERHFEVDAEGKARLTVPQADPSLEEAAAALREAETLCPTSAISVTE